MTSFPQIGEHSAPADIAAIYADIRSASGVPMINLIWRHFATLTGILPWAWGSVRPVVASSAMVAARARLARALVLPPALPRSGTAWREAGVDAADLSRVVAVLDAYIKGNLTNIIALTGLRRQLERPAPAAILVPGPDAPLVQSTPLDPLPSIGGLPPVVADRVRALAARHDGAGDGVIPSLYLALTPWPGLLAALPDWLATLYEPATLRAARSAICVAAEAEASRLLPDIGQPPAGAMDLLPVLHRFTGLVIPDLIPVCLALRRLTPAG